MYETFCALHRKAIEQFSPCTDYHCTTFLIPDHSLRKKHQTQACHFTFHISRIRSPYQPYRPKPIPSFEPWTPTSALSVDSLLRLVKLHSLTFTETAGIFHTGKSRHVTARHVNSRAGQSRAGYSHSELRKLLGRIHYPSLQGTASSKYLI